MEKKQKEKNPEAVRIGNILKKLMEDTDIKQTAAAKKWGIKAQASISAWINGEYCPSIESLYQIAKAEGLSVNYFFNEDPEKTKKETELFNALRSSYKAAEFDGGEQLDHFIDKLRVLWRKRTDDVINLLKENK